MILGIFLAGIVGLIGISNVVNTVSTNVSARYLGKASWRSNNILHAGIFIQPSIPL